jgi:hypothetical protein
MKHAYKVEEEDTADRVTAAQFSCKYLNQKSKAQVRRKNMRSCIGYIFLRG